MNLLKDKVTALAAVAALVVGAGGYFMLISPQQTQRTDLAETLQAQVDSNAALEKQLPVLKARLMGITSQVDALRDLSSKVPPQINQAELFDQLGLIAARAGVEELTSANVSVPQMVQAPAAAAAPTEDDGTLDDPTAEDQPAEKPAAAPAGGPVLAYYDLTMSVRGSTASTIAFLAELRSAPRINVISSSTMSTDGEATTLNISARMFLQQVDVDSLAGQIEELAETIGAGPMRPGGSPGSGEQPGSPADPNTPPGEHPEAVDIDPDLDEVDTSGGSD